MSRIQIIKSNQLRRSARVRSRVKGTPERPRLTVTVSNTHISAQVIDDQASKTLVSVTTVGQKSVTGTMTERATWVGTEIAKKASQANIKKVSFDRGSHRYHGRIKALAEAARAAGLEF